MITRDFFSDINRKWMKTHKIPKQDNRVSVYSLLENKIKKQLDGLIASDTKLQRVVSIFEKDYDTIALKRIDQLIHEYDKNVTFEEMMAWSFLSNISFPLKFGVGDDPKTPINTCFIIGEPVSLTFPSLSLYNDDNAKKHFLDFIKTLFIITHQPHEFAPQDVIDIEIRLSKSMYKSPHVPIEKLYNKCALSNELRSFLDRFGISHLKHNYVIVENPQYYKTILSIISMREFKTYMVYQTILSCAKFHKTLHKCAFNFFSKYLHGVKQDENHHRRSEHFVVSTIANIQVSKLYLKFYKNEAEIKLCHAMVKLLIKHMVKRLEDNRYLHNETKQKAIQKIQQIRFIVGHSDTFKTSFSIPNDENPFLIIEKYNKYKQNEMIVAMKRGQRRDFSQVWDDGKCGNVYDVNAYYIPTENAIVIPNGYLQPPFINTSKCFAYNLGILGTTIGHEMFHAIDDEGCKYDEKGNLRMWWKPDDFKTYRAHQRQVIRYYEEYAKRIDHKKIDGAQTLGENISDIGGFLLAEDVLFSTQSSSTFKHFYVAYAKQWRVKFSKKEEKNKLAVDVHAPSKYRTNLVLSYSSTFNKTFFSKDIISKAFFW